MSQARDTGLRIWEAWAADRLSCTSGNLPCGKEVQVA